MKLTKKHVLIGVMSLAVLVLPMVAGAQSTFGQDEMAELQGASGLGDRSLPELIGLIINVILSFLGIVAVIIVIGGGFMWMTAGGDDGKVTNAKNMIRNGIVGIVIVVASYAVANFVIAQLSEIAT